MANMTKWKEVLNWNIVPVFDSIHGMDDDRFFGCYYIPEKMNEYIDTIINSLTDGYGFNHKTILGDPGSGKTTFIYYLRLAIKKKKLDAKLHMEILHLQRLVSQKNLEDVITERVLKVLRNYFNSCSMQSTYEILTKDNTDEKISINLLKDYIIENNAKFNKRLIVVIDDVDETSEEEVEKCLRFLYSQIESEKISRWLMARPLTLENYNAKFGRFIETKFQQRSEFPKVDLYGIINARIKHDNPNGLNPFIPELCHQIIAANNNDLRISVSNSHHFLEELAPPSSSRNNEKFAGQYFLKNFTKIMTKMQIFPNIYRDTMLKTVPIERDVFLILATNNRFEDSFIKGLEAHYRRIYMNVHRKKYADQSEFIRLNSDHIKGSIYFLENNHLICEHGSIEGFYKLSPKGESFIRFLQEPLYTNIAKEDASLSQEKGKHPVFWDLAEMHPDYREN